ncbi:glycosyltransferase family 2 protein [Micromonospora sp. DT4]|uniref:glycosyltransferase family 2 protein n=1 Tax=Micromonospora sp. DT4 TaxID=3393438 RepID=UPI003CF85120
MKPLVTVVIPTYNRPGPLRHALASVAAQRAVPGSVEVVVVNDGGCDVSTVANAAREQGLVVRLIDLDQNGGLPSARNVGIQVARGDYLAFLDDDDIFLPSHLGTALAALSTGGADLAYTVCVVQEARVDPTNPPAFSTPTTFSFDPELLSVANFMPVHTAVLRRPPESARFDRDLPALEDWDMWLRLAREHRYRFVHVPEPTVVYHRIASEASMVGATVGDGHALAHFGALTEQMWCRWPARTPKAQHFRLYIAVMYWHSLARLAAGHALSDQYFQRCVAEIAAVWHGERSETGLRQRLIDSIKETADVAHAA